MRRYLPALLLVSAAVSVPLMGCDLIAKLKGGDADAGTDAATIVAVPAADVDAAPAVPAATVAATAAPLTTTAPTGTTVVRPVVIGDAGLPKDAGAVAIDAGRKDGGPAPAPTPTLNLPNLFDGGSFKFDAGGFKPP